MMGRQAASLRDGYRELIWLKRDIRRHREIKHHFVRVAIRC
jgi:hypothetical protein